MGLNKQSVKMKCAVLVLTVIFFSTTCCSSKLFEDVNDTNPLDYSKFGEETLQVLKKLQARNNKSIRFFVASVFESAVTAGIAPGDESVRNDLLRPLQHFFVHLIRLRASPKDVMAVVNAWRRITSPANLQALLSLAVNELHTTSGVEFSSQEVIEEIKELFVPSEAVKEAPQSHSSAVKEAPQSHSSAVKEAPQSLSEAVKEAPTSPPYLKGPGYNKFYYEFMQKKIKENREKERREKENREKERREKERREKERREKENREKENREKENREKESSAEESPKHKEYTGTFTSNGSRNWAKDISSGESPAPSEKAQPDSDLDSGSKADKFKSDFAKRGYKIPQAKDLERKNTQKRNMQKGKDLFGDKWSALPEASGMNKDNSVEFDSAAETPPYLSEFYSGVAENDSLEDEFEDWNSKNTTERAFDRPVDSITSEHPRAAQHIGENRFQNWKLKTPEEVKYKFQNWNPKRSAQVMT